MKPPRPRNKKLRIVITIVIITVLGAVGFGVYRYDRPLPALEVSVSNPTTATKSVSFPWTQSGESAISTSSNKVLGVAANADKVVPTASIAKLITIMTVLKKYPLGAGQSGRTITLTADDVARMKYYDAIDGSTVAVTAGQQLTEYQMFQAMLLPSANNIADSLAIWAFGSLATYKVAAQDVVNHLGMGHTLVGSDASGFLPDTTSTANDLVLLGEAALKEGVITEISAQRLALIPGIGTVYNTNLSLGQNGVTGLKTGTSDQAGNCVLFSATHTFNNGQTETYVGVILNSPSATGRFAEVSSLLDATYAGYEDLVVAKAGQSVGTIKSAWGESTAVVPSKDVSNFTWVSDPTTVTANISVGDAKVLDAGQTVGSVKSGTSDVPLTASKAINGPSFWWRILR